MKHYYAFYYDGDSSIPVYDRTFGTLNSALEWVKRNKHRDAFFTIDCLPIEYWY